MADDIPEHVGKPEVPALKAVRQFRMVEAHQVQDGGLQVVHVHRVFGDVVAEFVGGSERKAALDASAGHPDRERVRVVVTPEELGVVAGLVHGRAAKLAAPDDERIVEEAPLFEVLDERRGGPVGFLAARGE
jgi:hypothetical protein